MSIRRELHGDDEGAWRIQYGVNSLGLYVVAPKIQSVILPLVIT